MTPFPEALLQQAKAIEGKLTAFRRELHRHQELSGQEAETAGKVAAELRKLGFKPATGVGGHGVVAELEGGRPGPVIALRADMDALPIREETGLPFASARPGIMHACGHDGHTAMLLGAADLLIGADKRRAAQPTMAGEDFSEYLLHVPGCFFWLGSGPETGAKQAYGLHHPRFTLNEACLPYGAALLAAIPLFRGLQQERATI